MADPNAPEAPLGGAPPSGEERPASPMARLWAWGAVAVLCLLVAAQVAGVLLRDRLERRRPALTAAPAEPRGESGREPAPAEAPPRFGPDVREVEVAAPAGAPGTEGPLAPAPVAPAPPPAPPAAAVAVRPPEPPAKAAASAPAAARPSGASTAREAREGTHALLVDVFLSQRYLREAEAQVGALGLPHFVKEIVRAGRGFRVTAAGADRAKARKTLEAAGYACRDGKGGVEAFFYYRDEARSAADTLARVGIESATEETSGDRPFWKLYAGPFSAAAARDARGRLESRGLKTTLERRP